MKKEIIIFEGIEFYKIPHIDGYFVSKCGKVFSTNMNRLLKPTLGRGYEYVWLHINNKRKQMRIHRLVAITFLGFPVDSNLYATTKLTVNHINEIKNDNRLENLEVITHRNNVLHSSKSELGIKGVTIHNGSKPNSFRTRIEINNKTIHLGLFQTPEDAGRIYQLALQNIHLFDGDKKKFRELIQNTYEIEKEYI